MRLCDNCNVAEDKHYRVYLARPNTGGGYVLICPVDLRTFIAAPPKKCHSEFHGVYKIFNLLCDKDTLHRGSHQDSRHPEVTWREPDS